jgi:transposase-like protein
VIGADRHERTDERLGYRNGYRPRSLTTHVGVPVLLIPKQRAGSFLHSLLEPRRRVDQALYAVIMEAYIGGVSTRKVDALFLALFSLRLRQWRPLLATTTLARRSVTAPLHMPPNLKHPI